MKKEFNLSDYLYPLSDKRWVLPESKVKEFIKRLKEARGNCYECGCSLTDEDIDKLAGEKLI